MSAYEAIRLIGSTSGNFGNTSDKIKEVLDKITQYLRLGSEILWKKQIDLIHKVSRIIGTKYMQIQVLGTQEKKLQLGSFKARRLESPKHCIKSNLLGK